jgi:integrase/recombinase XerD
MCRWTYAINEYNRGTEADKIRQNLGVSKIQWREVHMKLRQLSAMAK